MQWTIFDACTYWCCPCCISSSGGHLSRQRNRLPTLLVALQREPTTPAAASVSSIAEAPGKIRAMRRVRVTMLVMAVVLGVLALTAAAFLLFLGPAYLD
jgi:hypothetical protein